MSVTYEIAHGAGGAAGGTGLLRLVAEAVASLLVTPAQDAAKAQRAGFAARAGEDCPYADARLARAYRRGLEEREEWAASAW